jgi:ribosomal protein S12 methylthiotransferase accessory factor
VREYRSDLRLEWVEGFDLVSRQPTQVPLNAVVCPYEPSRGRALYYSSTNGLASGNTLEEALCHALCEGIERDALAIALTSLELAPAVGQVLAGIGAAPAGGRATAQRSFPLISLDGLPRAAALLVRRLRTAGLRVYVRNITSAAGIPTFDCTIAEGRHLVHGGSGTHPDARVALTRALTEAAQSRVGCIQGGREDLPEVVRPRAELDPEEVYGGGPECPFSSIPSHEHDRVDEDIRFLLSHLKVAGFTQVVAFDLTRPELGIPVVRVVVPKAESWTVFHLHTGRGIFGSRVARVLSRAGGITVAESGRPRRSGRRWIGRGSVGERRALAGLGHEEVSA